MPPEAEDAIAGVLRSGRIAEGDWTRKFEDALSSYLGGPTVLAVSDIEAALTISLRIAGVGAGDGVVTSPMACLATNMPILGLSAKAQWADIDPATGMMTPESVAAAITPRTRAILVYHWGGDVADIRGIREVARDAGVRVVEDAQEAFGAEAHGRRLGNGTADLTCFSFYANRHITTIEGGAITMGDDIDAKTARLMKRYGIDHSLFRDTLGEIDPSCDIPLGGYNAYLPNVGASLGVAQLVRAEETVARHRANGAFYDEALAGARGISLLARPAWARSSPWIYTLRADRRDDLLRALRSRGIHASRVHHRNDTYSAYAASRVPLPGVDAFAANCLSIPCGWWVSDEDRTRVANAVLAGP